MLDTLEQAIYDTVHDYPRGAVGMAARVGMHPGTLQNKANPQHDAQLTLRESIPLQGVTSDYRILAAYAANLDHAVIPVGDFSDCNDMELLNLYAGYHAEVGETAQAIREALMAGGTVTTKAVRTVRKEMIEDIQAGLAFLSRLEGLAE